MKKKLFLFLFSVGIFIPFSVQAFELSCNNGLYRFEDYFICRLTGEKDKNYESLTGTISTDDNFSCTVDTIGQGLLNTSSDKKKIALSGTMNTNIIAMYRCQVVKKITTDGFKAQVTINDFKSKEKDAPKENSEILRSNYIDVEKYEVTTTTTTKQSKPRSTANSNSLLKVLSEKNLNFTFSRFITEYNLEVLYEVDRLDLKYAPANDNARIRIVGSTSLHVGDNIIDIYVTSPDNVATTCYTLNIKRLARGEEIYYPESDSSLSKLTIDGYPIQFDKDVFEYSIHIGSNVDSIKIDAVATFNGAIVDIANTSNLQNGKIATVTVTSKDGTKESKYKIKIQKDAPKKDYTSYYILGGCAFLVILIIVLFIRTSQKKKNDPLLKLKKEKRKLNKGSKFNISDVPEAQSQALMSQEESAVDGKETAEPNVVNLNQVNVTPTQIPEVQDENLNKITPVRDNLNLQVSDKATPMPVVESETINNISNSPVSPQESVPSNFAGEVPINNNQPPSSAVVQPVKQPISSENNSTEIYEIIE